MKQQFITRNGRSRLLLIFAGWAMDARPFTALSRSGYDIAVVWDYRTDDFDATPYAGYSEVVILAWSMGVWAAHRIIPRTGLPITLTIAINGSTAPVSDCYGIPLAIFRPTLDGLDERSLLKFYRRVAGSGTAFNLFARHMPQRPVNELRDELSRIEACGPAESTMRWDKAIISLNDAIFPAGNLRNQWQGKCDIIEIDGPHLPDWSGIINRFLIDKHLVENRFSKSQSTYPDEATVQQRIAAHLWDLWQKHLVKGHFPESVIEIGYGTGSFTRLYSQRLHPASLQLWDLVPSDPANLLPGTALCCDAETEIMKIPDCSADAIVSASTIQWFNSVGGFFTHALRTLRPGGLLVLSTFGGKTFRELAAAGTPSLPYLDLSALKVAIPVGFKILEAHEGIITKTFPSPIHVLRHIKATGVNAVRQDAAAAIARNILRDYPVTPQGEAPLTYNPIYLILQKS